MIAQSLSVVEVVSSLHNLSLHYVVEVAVESFQQFLEFPINKEQVV